MPNIHIDYSQCPLWTKLWMLVGGEKKGLYDFCYHAKIAVEDFMAMSNLALPISRQFIKSLYFYTDASTYDLMIVLGLSRRKPTDEYLFKALSFNTPFITQYRVIDPNNEEKTIKAYYPYQAIDLLLASETVFKTPLTEMSELLRINKQLLWRYFTGDKKCPKRLYQILLNHYLSHDPNYYQYLNQSANLLLDNYNKSSHLALTVKEKDFKDTEKVINVTKGNLGLLISYLYYDYNITVKELAALMNMTYVSFITHAQSNEYINEKHFHCLLDSISIQGRSYAAMLDYLKDFHRHL